MEVTHNSRRQAWAAEILATPLGPIDKVQKLVALGYDQEDAEAMVSGVQAGGMIYYEQIPRPDYDSHNE